MSTTATRRERSAVRIPVARSKALMRTMWWSVSAFLTGLAAYLIYSTLDFRPSAVTNRMVEYSIAVVALPAPGAAVFSAFRALRWAGLCVWPGRVEVLADERTLTLKLGPFGTHIYDAAGLDVRYPFELSPEAKEGMFEAFLPEEEQIACFLPRLLHPKSRERLDHVILRFVAKEERVIVEALRPVIQQWRSRKSRDEEARRSV